MGKQGTRLERGELVDCLCRNERNWDKKISFCFFLLLSIVGCWNRNRENYQSPGQKHKLVWWNGGFWARWKLFGNTLFVRVFTFHMKRKNPSVKKILFIISKKQIF